MNLLLADLIMALYGVPLDFYASLTHGWKMGKDMCEASGFILALAGNHTLEN